MGVHGTLMRGSSLPVTAFEPIVCCSGTGFSLWLSPRCVWLPALMIMVVGKTDGFTLSVEGTTISRWSSPFRYGSADGHVVHPIT